MGQDFDMRVFEVMCSGRPLVTDYSMDNGQRDMAWDGWEYDGQDEMFGILEEVLFDSERRAQVGRAGREYALSHHTYQHRARQLMRVVGLE
jgi:spore maturation protein CgeB